MTAGLPAADLPTSGRKPTRRRRWPRRLLAGGLGLLLVLGVALGVQSWRVEHALGQIKHFPTAVTSADPATGQPAQPALSLPAPLQGVVTFLVFTTGSHAMSKADAKKYGVPDVVARGTDDITDTIVLVSVNTRTGQISYLSIPRDTWVTSYGSKINSIYLTHGVKALVDEVQQITGVQVNHVVSLGFAAFGRFTDSVGGVDIKVPVPTRDTESHLNLPTAGCIRMDGRTALAFARSRHTDVYTPQQGWHRDPGASDLQRETRQQVIADAFVHKLLTPKLPLMAPTIASAVADEITTDQGLSIPTLISTAVALARHGHITTRHFVLPSTFGTVGSASVTFVDTTPAARVLEAFGHDLPGFVLPSQYPRVRVPSGGSAKATAPTATVVPDGLALDSTAKYSVCG